MEEIWESSSRIFHEILLFLGGHGLGLVGPVFRHPDEDLVDRQEIVLWRVNFTWNLTFV
jgi:hypothetical protein